MIQRHKSKKTTTTPPPPTTQSAVQNHTYNNSSPNHVNHTVTNGSLSTPTATAKAAKAAKAKAKAVATATTSQRVAAGGGGGGGSSEHAHTYSNQSEGSKASSGIIGGGRGVNERRGASYHHHALRAPSSHYPAGGGGGSGGSGSIGSIGTILSALWPSLLCLSVLALALAAQRYGFRGRATMAGIDLGTTHSVICVQSPYHEHHHSHHNQNHQNHNGDAGAGGGGGEGGGGGMQGTITCIPDPVTQSPIIPSVVSFLNSMEQLQQQRTRAAAAALLLQEKEQEYKQVLSSHPSPSHRLGYFAQTIFDRIRSRYHRWRRNVDYDDNGDSSSANDVVRVLVGEAAKQRIDAHPHHTLYHAKRVLGRTYHDLAVQQLQREVDFAIVRSRVHDDDDHETEKADQQGNDNDNDKDDDSIYFHVPDIATPHISPVQVGSYIVQYLKDITHAYLGHSQVQQAVICVPAKFTPHQRALTVQAFVQAGLTPIRILEEPTAAALAYNLHNKVGVDYVLVYDLGGGTLDVSVLRVSSSDKSAGGFVDVIASDGDDRLGGSQFDAAIAQYWMQSPVQIINPTLLSSHHPITTSAVAKDDSANCSPATNTTDFNNMTGREILDSTQRYIQHLQEQLQKNLNGGVDDPYHHYHHHHVEELLMTQCAHRFSAMMTTTTGTSNTVHTLPPLCTVSSLHSLAEQVKIQFSSLIDDDDDDTNHDGENKEAVVTVQCLAPLVSTTDDDHRPLPPSILAKVSASASSSDSFVLGHNHNNDDMCDMHHLRIVALSLTVPQFTHMIQPLLQQSIAPVHRLLRDLGLHPHDIPEVVLVGGATRMPHIRQCVRNYFLPTSRSRTGSSSTTSTTTAPTTTTHINTHIDPDLTVAYGAASVID